MSPPSPLDGPSVPFTYDNSAMLAMKDHGGEHDDDDERDMAQDHGGDGDGDGNSQGSGKRSRTRRPHLQGRFSGRLTTKEDERRLAEECKLLGPLLGGVGKRGDKSRLTLAKIVRGIATGEVRRFCEERERAIQLLKQKLAAIDPEAAASVPVHPISAGALGPGGSGPVGSMSMSMGGPSGSLGGVGVNVGMGVTVGMGVQVNAGTVLQLRAQLEHAQHEMGELQDEVRALRSELEARERLLLQLQDTGIISGFVPSVLSLKQEDVGAAGMGRYGSGPSRSLDAGPGGYGRGGHMGQGMRQGYGGGMGSYNSGGGLQMGLSQQGLVGSGSMGAAPHSSGMGGPSAGQLQLMGNASEQLPMQPMAAGPSVSEHSRASRPVKRANGMGLGDLALGAAGMGSMGPDAANLPPRSMSYPVPGVARGGSGVDDGGTGGGGSYTQAGGDLQQRLSSLQNQGGLLMLPDNGGFHPSLGPPLHLQLVKNSNQAQGSGQLYDLDNMNMAPGARDQQRDMRGGGGNGGNGGGGRYATDYAGGGGGGGNTGGNAYYDYSGGGGGGGGGGSRYTDYAGGAVLGGGGGGGGGGGLQLGGGGGGLEPVLMQARAARSEYDMLPGLMGDGQVGGGKAQGGPGPQ